MNREAGALQLAFRELDVALDVFHHDDSEFLAHRLSLIDTLGWLLRASTSPKPTIG
jgi:hypothetical protein